LVERAGGFGPKGLKSAHAGQLFLQSDVWHGEIVTSEAGRLPYSETTIEAQLPG
jgi:hypothetical protein